LAQYPEATSAKVGAIYLDSGLIGAKRELKRADAEAIRQQWAMRAGALFVDETYEAKKGRGCYWCAYKDSLGGPCAAWRPG
jgi:hypothetical protein